MNMDGEWNVTVLGPWGELLNPLGDHKIIKGKEGFNQMGIFKFGYFNIKPRGKKILLDYNHPLNKKHLRNIVDTLVKISDTEYIGELHYAGTYGFDFLLKKIEP